MFIDITKLAIANDPMRKKLPPFDELKMGNPYGLSQDEINDIIARDRYFTAEDFSERDKTLVCFSERVEQFRVLKNFTDDQYNAAIRINNLIITNIVVQNRTELLLKKMKMALNENLLGYLENPTDSFGDDLQEIFFSNIREINKTFSRLIGSYSKSLGDITLINLDKDQAGETISLGIEETLRLGDFQHKINEASYFIFKRLFNHINIQHLLSLEQINKEVYNVTEEATIERSDGSFRLPLRITDAKALYDRMIDRLFSQEQEVARSDEVFAGGGGELMPETRGDEVFAGGGGELLSIARFEEESAEINSDDKIKSTRRERLGSEINVQTFFTEKRRATAARSESIEAETSISIEPQASASTGANVVNRVEISEKRSKSSGAAEARSREFPNTNIIEISASQSLSQSRDGRIV